MSLDQNPSKSRSMSSRIAIYAVGFVILTLGVTMNTKAGLGVSPLISVAFGVAEIWDHSFANMTLALYCFYVVVQMVLHTLHAQGIACKGHPPRHKLSTTLLLDALQFPVSLVFSRFIDFFDHHLPNLAVDCAGTFWGTLPGQLLFLLVGLSFMGIGAAMTLDMRFVPTPGEGIIQALADTTGRETGLCKNGIDVASVSVTTCLSLVFAGHIIGIGVGTLISMLWVGRVIALFNRLAQRKLEYLAGLPA